VDRVARDKAVLIEPGCLTQNACVARFNGSFCNECVNEH
jgi:hypothetical protein